MYDLILHLPFPPSEKSYYAIGKSKNKYVTKVGKAYQTAIAESVHEQSASINIMSPISMTVILYMPDRRVRDVDNYMKALLDGLDLAGVYDDDNLVDQLHSVRGEVVKGGSCVVLISDAAPVLPIGFDIRLI